MIAVSSQMMPVECRTGRPTYGRPAAESMRRKSGVPIGLLAAHAASGSHQTILDCPTSPFARGCNVPGGAYLWLIPVPSDNGPRYSVEMSNGLQRCYTDAYAAVSEGLVAAVRHVGDAVGEVGVLLGDTPFYPGGGGQPSDRGRIVRLSDERWWSVVEAHKVDGEILHVLDPSIGTAALDPPAAGERVRAEIDWERRYRLMRTHTALHVLCGVVWRDYGAQVTGGNMEPGAGRMDFEFERMTGELVGEIEARVNHEIGLKREIRVRLLPRDEAFAIPDLIRTKVNLLPPGIAEVRTIEIVGLDLQADGGTHVANTREVGRVRVQGYESKGRINKRIRIAIEDA
jgi:misacylated tRNA(Ala) deacylase